jgi:hypothetical protein
MRRLRPRRRPGASREGVYPWDIAAVNTFLTHIWYGRVESKCLMEVFMIPLSSAISGGLVWSKTLHKPGYELRRDGEVVGSLRRTSCWSSEFQAESRHGSWRFRRTGFSRGRTEIVDADSRIQIAVLKRNWGGGGTLAFSDGQTFQLTAKGWWRPVWTVLADNGQPVLSIRSREKTVDLPNQLHLPEGRLILLAIFTRYVMQQAAEDAAAVAVMAAATS